MQCPLYATFHSPPYFRAPSLSGTYLGTSKFANIAREHKYSRTIDKSAFHAPTTQLHTADGVSIPVPRGATPPPPAPPVRPEHLSIQRGVLHRNESISGMKGF